MSRAAIIVARRSFTIGRRLDVVGRSGAQRAARAGATRTRRWHLIDLIGKPIDEEPITFHMIKRERCIDRYRSFECIIWRNEEQTIERRVEYKANDRATLQLPVDRRIYVFAMRN